MKHATKMMLAVAVLAMVAVSAQGATLEHRWSFTTDATDSVGSADGTLFGSATVTGGKLDTLSGGYMSTAGIKATVQVDRNLTVEAWVTDVATPDNYDRVWSWGTNATSNDFTVYARHDMFSGNALGVLNTPGQNAVNNVGTQNVSGTQHVVLVVDKTNNQKRYYVDGALVNGVSLNGRGVDDMDHTSAAYILGARFDAAGQLAGKYDEYRIWDGAMTDAEVTTRYNAGADVIPEPATMSLLGIGGLLALVRRRRK